MYTLAGLLTLGLIVGGFIGLTMLEPTVMPWPKKCDKHGWQLQVRKGIDLSRN